MLKKILLIAGSIIIILLIAALLLGPGMIDRSMNTVTLPPPYTVSPRAQQLYDSLEFIADLHSDALLWKRNLLDRHDYGSEDIPRMLQARLALQAFTIVTKTPRGINFDKNTDETDQIRLLYMLQARPIGSWFSLTERALVQCRALFEFARESNGAFRVIRSQKDLRAYLRERESNKNITAGFLGIEGMHALDGELENVDVLYDAGVRMMAPVHFFDNKLGGSAHGVTHGGLTDFGAQVIRRMQEKNMIVDIAHSSEKLIDDILRITTKPVITSHTGVKGTCDNVRNLSDKHLKGVAATGGLIGIAFFKQAVCGTNAEATAKAIRYTADLLGIEHVALGSDFDGAIQAHFDVTGLPLLVEELLKLGMSPQDIALVMGENVKRFMLDNLPEE